MTGVYVHVPFCLGKCLYCSFDSVPAGMWDRAFVESYLASVASEMERASRRREFSPVSSVYFGGGTPSVLRPDDVEGILGRVRGLFGLCPGAEVSMEVNPGTSGAGTLGAFRDAGVNRVSIGGQSFDDSLLMKIGRMHDSGMLERTLASACRSGFDSVGVDIIFGFPDYGLDLLVSDLEKASSFPVDHLSLYMFTPEPGTPMGDAVLSGAEEAPEDDALAMMMDTAHEILSGRGFEHYEISNFARGGRRCRHNMLYWGYGEYLGFGSSACSFLGGVRSRNVSGPFRYAAAVSSGKSPVASAEKLSARRRMGEYAMLALRTSDGVDAGDFAMRFGRSFSHEFARVLGPLLSGGLLVRDGDRFFVPFGRFCLQSSIAAEFL